MTAPPGTQPTPNGNLTVLRPKRDRRAEAERHKAAQADALAARQQRAQVARAAAEESFAEAQRVPRKRKLSACDQRVGGPNWRTKS